MDVQENVYLVMIGNSRRQLCFTVINEKCVREKLLKIMWKKGIKYLMICCSKEKMKMAFFFFVWEREDKNKDVDQTICDGIEEAVMVVADAIHPSIHPFPTLRIECSKSP